VDQPGTAVERLDAQLGRTVDRLRTLGPARLAAPFEPEPTRAEAAHGVAQRLEDLVAELESREPMTLPRLADAAVGDQVAVLGHDLLAALRRGGGVGRGETVAGVAADLLLDLRRRL
jgi:hypothetical protein